MVAAKGYAAYISGLGPPRTYLLSFLVLLHTVLFLRPRFGLRPDVGPDSVWTETVSKSEKREV